MKIHYKASLILFLLTSMMAGGQTGGSFTISKSTIDTGGGSSVSGSLILEGTIGQTDANSIILSGGAVELTGGMHLRTGVNDIIFKHGFE